MKYRLHPQAWREREVLIQAEAGQFNERSRACRHPERVDRIEEDPDA